MPLPTMADRTRLSESSSSTAKVPELFSPFPGIWEFLTVTSLPDQSTRLPGKLSLALESGMWKLTLSDASTGLYAPMNGDCLEDLLLKVEDLLQKGLMPWKVSSYTAKVPKKKA